MFDLAWSELALIAVVAVVVIGPKDLPDAIRNVAKGVQKLRRMAAEFQSQADELVREAKLEDVRDQIRDIRNFDLKSTIERNLDSDGEIRRTFNDDPLKDAWKPEHRKDIGATKDAGTDVSAPVPPAGQEPGPAPQPAVTAEPPAFVPPSVAADANRETPTAPPASGLAQTAPDKPATPNV